MPATDLLLWRRFIEGDEEAYACIYRQYVDSLYAYASCFISDKCLVEDCIQDLFIKIYQNRKSLKETDNIKLYLYLYLSLVEFCRTFVQSIVRTFVQVIFSLLQFYFYIIFFYPLLCCFCL